MSECYLSKYLHNQEVKDTRFFDADLIFRGESLYELFRIIKKIPLFWEDHISRLYLTSQITGLKIWLDEETIKNQVSDLIRINSVAEGNIKLVFNFRKSGLRTRKNFLIYFVEPVYPTPNQYLQGVNGILYQASRINPTAKVINQNLRIAVYKKLIEKGAYEALLVDRKGEITEGSRSNIFMIRDGHVFTAPDPVVLPGIARKHVLSICRSRNIPLSFEKIKRSDLEVMDAVFMTGTSPRVLPFSRIEEFRFNPADPVLMNIIDGYDEKIHTYIAGSHV
ncbi:MAG: aminotransferase class IV family protein [Bacteroidales bacterium]|nr:MAG: aminotransferase class IV family protein [Bacteroidales bacterium]